MPDIPTIDDRIKYRGASVLRDLNTKALRELKDVIVIQIADAPGEPLYPVAVIFPYELYMELQKILWPSTLVPSLDRAFTVQAIAEEEDGRAVALGEEGGFLCEPAVGVMSRPSVDIPPEVHMIRADGQELCSNRQKGASYAETANPESITCAQCQPEISRPSQISSTLTSEPQPQAVEKVSNEELANIKVTNIKVNGEERGPQEYDGSAIPHRSRLHKTIEMEHFVDVHGTAAAIRKVAAEYDQAVAQRDGLCAHCGNPHETPLCSSCFMAGHRNGNCLKCGEAAK